MLPATAAVGAGMVACGRKKSPRYQGFALIANRESRTLAIIDLSRFQTLKQIPLDSRPAWVIPVPAQNRAYILGTEQPGMDVLNLDTMLLEKRIPFRGKPGAALLSKDQKTIWVLLESPDTLAAFHPGTRLWETRASLPAAGNDLDELDGSVAIAFRDRNQVGLLTRSHPELHISQPLASAPRLIRIRGDSKVLLTGNTEDRSMTAIDARTLAPLVQLPLSLAPRHFCFNNDGGQLFVTGDGLDAVVIVSPYQTEVNETILAGNAPAAMAATSAAPNYLFVTNPVSGDVTIINIDNRKVLAQIPVGQRPGTVLLTPDNEYALVLNEQSGDVAVIRLMNIRKATPESRRARMAALFTLIPVGSGPVNGAVTPRLI